jgi:hypothetical protein
MKDRKSAGWLFWLVLLTTSLCWPGNHMNQPKRATPLGYELYSWQDDPKGTRWNFSLLYTTNRGKTVKEVFDRKIILRGVEQFKHRVSELPKGSMIVWTDRLMLNGQRLKGSERLGYPPPDVREEVRNYIEGRQIELVEGTDYLLYSWEAPNGQGWDFQLLKVGDHENTVNEIFNERTVLHGLDEIGTKLSSIESGSYVVWTDARVVRGKGSERLRYPSAEVVDKIRRDAMKRKLKISGP